MKYLSRAAIPLSFIAFALASSGCADAIDTCKESRSCADGTGSGGKTGGRDDGDGDGDDDDTGKTTDDGDGGERGNGDGDGDGKPEPCAEGSWDDDDDPATACVDWSSCEPGAYIDKSGSPTTDQRCAPCEAGSFSVEANAQKCVSFSECTSGILEEGSTTSDFKCAAQVTDVAVGSGFSCILREDGTAACWGKNDLGQLGSGKNLASGQAVPVMVDVDGGLEPLTDIVELSAGADFACAVRDDGGVWCWGSNSSEQLGEPTAQLASSFTALAIADVEGAVAVSAGYYHACALLEDKTARCWGASTFPELLGGGTTLEERIVTVLAPEDDGSALADIVEISVGQDQSCAVVASGEGYCWGHQGKGNYGELGLGSPLEPVPSLVRTGMIGVEAGALLTCWSTEEGGVECHGRSPAGDIFTPEAADDEVPGLTSMVADGSARCLLLEDGSVWCWGDNAKGQLGNDTNEDSDTLVQVQELSDIVALDAGYSHACAVDGAGRVSCWGQNTSGELGNRTIFESGTPLPVPDVAGAVSIGSGGNHTCVVLDSGRLKCWGSNAAGALGIDSDVTMSPPVELSGISGVKEFAAYGSQNFAVKTDGTVRRWGGGLGGNNSVPSELSGLSNAVAVGAGGEHACAALQNGTVQCWGDNFYGQAGFDRAETTTVAVPSSVSGAQGVDDVKAGNSHSCLLSDGAVQCWGANVYGQTGQGPQDHFTPMPVAGLSDIVAISLGANFSLALREDGQILSFGLRYNGALGDGLPIATHAEMRKEAEPVVGVSSAVSISAGSHSCAALSDGSAMCWGVNDAGQLGSGDRSEPNSLAQPVIGLSDAVAVAVGGSHSCALHSDGTVSCWGSNELYQMGHERSDESLRPVEVIWP